MLYLINKYLNGKSLNHSSSSNLTDQKMTSSKSPKNWSEWNNTKHFTDYSRDSGTGKFVRYTIAALLFVPVGFLAYMTTI